MWGGTTGLPKPGPGTDVYPEAMATRGEQRCERFILSRMENRSHPGLAPWAQQLVLVLVVVLAGCTHGRHPLAGLRPNPSSPPVPSGPAMGVIGSATPTTTGRIPFSPPDPALPGPLSVDAHAWIGHGDLAFVSDGRLHILTNVGQLVSIHGPGAGFDSEPVWSADRHWLAFVHTGPPTGSMGNATLWVAAAGSPTAHEVSASGIDAFAWSPAASTLAFTTVPAPATASGGPGGLASFMDALWLDTPGQAPRALPQVQVLGGFAWSPDGRELAIGGWAPSRGTPAVQASGTFSLRVIPLNGSATSTWMSTSQSEVVPLSWWPDGAGLVYWLQTMQSNSFLDGVPVYSLAKGGQPRMLGTMLEDTSWLAWSPTGTAVALVTGGNRQIWGGGKDVEVCALPSGGCRPLNIPPGSVALSPGWSSSGSLSYLTASASGAFGPSGGAFYSGGWMAQWNGTYQLQTLNGGTSSVLTGAGPGVVAVTWSAKGTDLIEVRDDAVWLVGPGAAAAVRIAGPIFPEVAPSGYYGLVDWPGMLAWSAQAPPSMAVLVATVGEDANDMRSPG